MGIMDLFKKSGKRKEGFAVDNVDEKYREYVESIDDNGLSKLFVTGITPELEAERYKYGHDPYKYPLRTIVSAADTDPAL